jgi:hypothetical protein
LVVGVMLYIPVFRGHKVVNGIHQLRVGSTNFAATRHIAESLGARQVGGDICTPRSCAWKVVIENDRIPAWWRGSTTTLSAVLTVEDDVLVQKSLDFGRGSLPRDPKVDVIEQVPTLWKMHSSISISPGYDEQKRAVTAFVRLSPSASQTERERYSNLNLDCLWRFKGCTLVHQFLPAFSDQD